MELPKITANSMEQFKAMEDLLKALPEKILEQIELVESGQVGLKCIIKNSFKDELKIWLPDYVTQISDFDDYIGIYADKYFFEIPKATIKNKKITYLFMKV